MHQDQFTRREVNGALLFAAWVLAAPGGAPIVRRSEHLFDFAIAGGWYHGLKHVRNDLASGEHLTLRPEPDNPHDGNAVAVLRANGLVLGYVPRKANQPIFRLLASGTAVDAQVAGRLVFYRVADITDDFAFTGFTSGDPRIRLTLRT